MLQYCNNGFTEKMCPQEIRTMKTPHMVSLYIGVSHDVILNTRFTVLDSQIYNRLCGKQYL